MKSIDINPIRVGHIPIIQDVLGVNATDLAWALGATPAHWGAISRDIRMAPDRLLEAETMSGDEVMALLSAEATRGQEAG